MVLARKYDPFGHHAPAADDEPESVPADPQIRIVLLTPAELDSDTDPGDEELQHRAVLIEEYDAEPSEETRPEVEDATGARYRYVADTLDPFEPFGDDGPTDEEIDQGEPEALMRVAAAVWQPVDPGDEDDDDAGDDAGDDETGAPAATKDNDELQQALADMEQAQQTEPKPKRKARK